MVMVMKNNVYWEKRMLLLEKSVNKQTQTYYKDLERQYKLANKKVEREIEYWYQRIADNNQITLRQAKTLLKKDALAEFHWNVDEYIKYGEKNALDPLWMKQLENASAKMHITKLEAMKMQSQHHIEVLFGKQQAGLTNLAGNLYKDQYYHTAYEIQKGFNIGYDLQKITTNKVDKIISKPWTIDKKTFSDRIWLQKQDLIKTVHTELTQGIIRGEPPDKAIKVIAQKFNTSKGNAGRLIMTESAFFASAAQKDAFNDLEVERFEIVATLDLNTSEICQELDGKVFDMVDYEVGVTAPPFHPWCRTVTAPYFDDDFGSRAARDVDGKTYYVPSDMNYKDWKETFVNGGDKTGLTMIDDEGVISWFKNIPDVLDIPDIPEVKAKKEYLTKKKLQEKLAEVDMDIQKMQKEQINAAFGYTPEEIEKDFGGIDKFFDPSDDVNKMKFIVLGEEIEQLKLKQAEWQVILEKKLNAEKIKNLKKEIPKVQAEFDALTNESFSGIWKDDVKLSDWNSKKGGIPAKKTYFQDKLNTTTDAEYDKFENLLKQLDDFDAKGQQYYDVESKLKKLKMDLLNAQKNSNLKVKDDVFSQERKDAALWAKDTKEADDILRTKCGEIWENASIAEKDAIYDYTGSYSKYNEPTRGYDYGTNKFLGVGNVDFNQIGVNYGGYKPGEIKGRIDSLTSIIEKSTYDHDMWVQRGVDYRGMDRFFGVNSNDFNLSEGELQAKLLGTTPTDYGFFSCGVSKGKGFSNKPIIMNIYAPSGTKMMYAEPFSAFGGGAGKNWDGKSKQNNFGYESEIIFQRGTSFRITKLEKNNGKIYMDLEVINQESY